MRRAAICCFVVALAGCGGGAGAPDPGTVLEPAPLLLAAGMVALEPLPVDTVSAGLDLGRLGITDVDAVYEVTTPANEPFAFDLLTRADSNAGGVRVSLGHAADDGQPPVGGPETMAEVGVVPSATGTSTRGGWIDAQGDGFARITVRGEIDRAQVFAVQAGNGGDETTALISVTIGPQSEINLMVQNAAFYPGIVEQATLYSSNSWLFGLPTVAVSGDRASVITYEGDRAQPHRPDRYEMRLQYDLASGAVTGGGSDESSPDSGNWRDHEIAGLFNVLVLVHSGSDAASIRISFDRGATFDQEEILPGSNGFQPRLAQVAIAADYSLAVLYWRTTGAGSNELVLVEGRPSAFDATGSPSRFTFDPARTLNGASNVTPLLMGAAWSEGGDLAIGYAFSSFMSNGDGTWTSRTEFWSAVRLFGGDFVDTLVEEGVIVGRDPSVSLVGSGASLRIFYAYESGDGVRLRTSTDGGRTFSPPSIVGDRSAMMPMVLARLQGGGTRVDLLYLIQDAEGRELHLRHWDDFDSSVPTDHRLTRAKTETSRNAPPGSVPGAPPGILAPDYGFRITEVAWFGYDATLDGDDVVVVYDEQTYDAAVFFLGAPFADLAVGVAGALPSAAEIFTPADPPPLDPGMTEPVPAPDPDHMHQLKLLRLN